jgi:hypothetical protein
MFVAHVRRFHSQVATHESFELLLVGNFGLEYSVEMHVSSSQFFQFFGRSLTLFLHVFAYAHCVDYVSKSFVNFVG